MIRLIGGYWRTLKQYAAAPKTQYEYKHYALFLLYFTLVVFLVWGGIYVWKSLD